jgi:hypothetical protein
MFERKKHCLVRFKHCFLPPNIEKMEKTLFEANQTMFEAKKQCNRGFSGASPPSLRLSGG